jgi:hypothetical protein
LVAAAFVHPVKYPKEKSCKVKVVLIAKSYRRTKSLSQNFCFFI